MSISDISEFVTLPRSEYDALKLRGNTYRRRALAVVSAARTLCDELEHSLIVYPQSQDPNKSAGRAKLALIAALDALDVKQ